MIVPIVVGATFTRNVALTAVDREGSENEAPNPRDGVKNSRQDIPNAGVYGKLKLYWCISNVFPVVPNEVMVAGKLPIVIAVIV